MQREFGLTREAKVDNVSNKKKGKGGANFWKNKMVTSDEIAELLNATLLRSSF